MNLFKRPTKDTIFPPKRAKHGHENTKMAFCLSCFRTNKPRFWLSRYNKSTIASHLKHVHKGDMTIEEDVVEENSPAAKDALAAYQR